MKLKQNVGLSREIKIYFICAFKRPIETKGYSFFNLDTKYMDQKTHQIENLHIHIEGDLSQKPEPQITSRQPIATRLQKSQHAHMNISERPTAGSTTTRLTPGQHSVNPKLHHNQTLTLKQMESNATDQHLSQDLKNFTPLHLQESSLHSKQPKKRGTQITCPQHSGTQTPAMQASPPPKKIQNKKPVTLPSINNGGFSPAIGDVSQNPKNSSMSQSNENSYYLINASNQASEGPLSHIRKSTKKPSQSPHHKQKYESSKFQQDLSINSSLNYQTISTKNAQFKNSRALEDVGSSFLKTSEIYGNISAYQQQQRNSGMKSDHAFYQHTPLQSQNQNQKKGDGRSRATNSPNKTGSQLRIRGDQLSEIIGVPDSIIKQLKKSLNSSEYDQRKHDGQIQQKNPKGDKMKQSSVAMRKAENWNDVSDNNLNSFDHKHADTGKRDLTAEIFDSMNLNIKQILQERPNNLRNPDNNGFGTDDVQLRKQNLEADIQYDFNRKMLSQTKNYSQPTESALQMEQQLMQDSNGQSSQAYPPIPSSEDQELPKSKLTNKQVEF